MLPAASAQWPRAKSSYFKAVESLNDSKLLRVFPQQHRLEAILDVVGWPKHCLPLPHPLRAAPMTSQSS